jgi:predicted Zn-dependent protease
MPLIGGRRRWLLALGLAAILAGVWPAWASIRDFRDRRAARNLLHEGRMADAIATLDRLAERDPDDAEYQYLLAVAHRRSGVVAGFDKHLERAAQLGWPAEDLERQQVLLLIQAGDVERGQTYLESLPERPQSDEAAEEFYEAYVVGCASMHRLREAQGALYFWSQWQPNNPVPRLWLANVYERQDKWDLAREEYEAVLKLDPDNAAAAGGLGGALLNEHRIKEARALLTRASASLPGNTRFRLTLAQCEERLGNTAEARRLAEEVVRSPNLEPEAQARAKVLLGRLLLSEGKPEEAISLLREAVTEAPYERTAHYALGQALHRIGRVEEANQAFERNDELTRLISEMYELILAVGADPENVEARYQVAKRMFQLGMERPAVGWLMTILVIDPNHLATHQRLAEYYEAVGDLPKARHERQILEALRARSADAVDAGEAAIPEGSPGPRPARPAS